MSIVSDVKERGFEAVREWALKLDGAEPRARWPTPEGLPREALLQLADRVRRWHEAQRPADISSRWSLASRSSGAGCRSTPSASTCRAT